MGKKKYTNEQLLEILQNRTKELNKIPAANDMSSPTHKTYIKRFGSWNNALKLAFGEELDNYKNKHTKCIKEKHIKKEKYSKEELIEILKTKFKELKRLPKANDFNDNQPNTRTFINIFGSWNNALIEAFENDIKEEKVFLNKKRYSKEELIKILKEKYNKLGRLPMLQDFNNCSPSFNTFVNKFGSWKKALIEAGLIDETYKLPKRRNKLEDKYNDPYQLTDYVKMIPDKDGNFKFEIIKKDK